MVSRPETVPAKSCGFTTQKIVLSASRVSASLTVSIVTRTLERSGAMVMVFTVPMTTLRYFNCDCPAVSPTAVLKVTVMVGPRLEKVSQASQPAIIAVRMGTIQTSGMRRR